MPGALEGLTVIEFAGIGPGPFACMMLADHGARVIRIERPGRPGRFGDNGNTDILNRNRLVVELDMKDPAAIARVRELVREADAIVEGYRPGVMERLGIGPEVLLADNPRLVYGRMTGWASSMACKRHCRGSRKRCGPSRTIRHCWANMPRRLATWANIARC